MVIVDNALRARAAAGNPIRVGLIGAGSMGGATAAHIIRHVPGLRLSAISNRQPQAARSVYAAAGIDATPVATSAALQQAIAQGGYAITDDPTLVCESDAIDVLIEATGTIEFAAQVVTRALAHRKHVVLVNAELDATLGPILKVHADRAGVVITGADGDQPAAQMNLFRFVSNVGLEPLVCGNIKGLEDHYRTPTTQEGFARRWRQQPHMATSFADGTKISFEQAVVANATGMRVARRGMGGGHHDGHVDALTTSYDVDQLRGWGGVVDYVVGARPGPGVYVFAAARDPGQRHYLELYKLGPGPLYSFYTPFHLCHLEVPFSVVRAVDFRDAAIAPLGPPVVEVVATAKTDLKRGQTLDGIGRYTLYGQCENTSVVQAQHLLPIGLAEGGVLRHDVKLDEVLTIDAVDLPADRLCDRLYAEQRALLPSLVRA